MKLTETGNLGIGTSNPSQKLVVVGTIESTTGGIKFPDGTTQTTAVTSINDADADPSNEIQDITFDGANLSISSGTTVDLSVLQDGTMDADADPTNEIQDIVFDGVDLSISSGSTVDLSVLQDGTTDADADPNNEIQTLSINVDPVSYTHLRAHETS